MAFQEAWKFLVDSTVKAIKVVSVDNSLVHDGRVFHHKGYHSVANGANLDHLIVTSNTDVHFRSWQVKSNDGPVYISVYEGATTSANGSAEGVGNTNRQSVITPTTSLYLAPTVTGTGSLLINDFIGTTGGGAHTVVGDPAQAMTEWVLKKNTKYLFRCLNSSGSTTNITVAFSWFE